MAAHGDDHPANPVTFDTAPLAPSSQRRRLYKAIRPPRLNHINGMPNSSLLSRSPSKAVTTAAEVEMDDALLGFSREQLLSVGESMMNVIPEEDVQQFMQSSVNLEDDIKVSLALSVTIAASMIDTLNSSASLVRKAEKEADEQKNAKRQLVLRCKEFRNEAKLLKERVASLELEVEEGKKKEAASKALIDEWKKKAELAKEAGIAEGHLEAQNQFYTSLPKAWDEFMRLPKNRFSLYDLHCCLDTAIQELPVPKTGKSAAAVTHEQTNESSEEILGKEKNSGSVCASASNSLHS